MERRQGNVCGGIYVTKGLGTNINCHEVTVTQGVHVFQHVTFVKHSILQTQFAEKAAIVVVSYCQVVPVNQSKHKSSKITMSICD